ncbi:zinc/iron permease [Heterostelium album PN500]|uniref:Zinc/iron permease n=1 Tax=Heterostelium pallidum (strain ATCC 26659 / Pp 5 / PN500) TaxID=670386 RepID=D3B511_HETP5|nr:zinc/iron permease [Heterostelium album PN500]EFA84409.1 zinc/iron permease [Heterostelium album PN500]|eukprot:XP_020436523.1 zinc/iron permease [Heterostelium album PN500]
MSDHGHSHSHGSEDCEGQLLDDYNQALHIGSIFIILVASFLGTAIPIVSNFIKILNIPKYIIVLGKCMGVGVILAAALIHMLLPANASLSSPCLPETFTESYEAWAFMFCVTGAIAMQLIDFLVLQYIQHRTVEKRATHPDPESPTPIDCGKLDESTDTYELQTVEVHKHGGHGHSHGGFILTNSELKTVEAYMLEFGVTVHSVFVGLAIGVADDTSLRALLVALCFHQFFEGLALGARINDAKASRLQQFILSMIFSISAPIGIAIGVGVSSTLNTNGVSFLFVQGIFDAICAGILLYIGFSMLLKDFPEDMNLHCKEKKHEQLRKAGMFAALWVGSGLMAYIGRYL